MSDRGVLEEKVRVLDKSRSGYLAVLTRLCNEIDENINNVEDVERIQTCGARLAGAFERYKECCRQYANLLDTSCGKYQQVEGQFEAQKLRVKNYERKINLFIEREVELEMTRLEIEIKQTETELRKTLELSKMQANSDKCVISPKIGPVSAVSDLNQTIETSQQCDNQETPPKWEGLPELEELIVPPPPMFSNNETSGSPDMIDALKTSTPKVRLPLHTNIVPSTDYDNEPLKSNNAFKCAYTVKDEDWSTVRLPETETHPPKHHDASAMTNKDKQPATTVYVPTTPNIGRSVDTPSTEGTLINETLLTTIVSTMDKISVSHNLPSVQVLKFDGSPDKYLGFRQRFKQLVGSRPLDDAVKMTRLLQFLEGPALTAVQRYETIPGGLERALKVLEERFGRPYQVVKACIETMTKGPVIQVNDRQALQNFADAVQASYDTLDAMGYLSEMNTDNLEKIMARLPRQIQSRFIELLSKRERKGQNMPRFKDVVEFLRDRADVVNHPFLAKSPVEGPTSIKPKMKTTVQRVSTFATTTTINPAESCMLCSKSHRLYHCDAFKAKAARERNDFVKSKHICFNCLCSTRHNSKTCRSLTRCRAPGCNKPHHTLLHFPEKRDTEGASATAPSQETSTTHPETATGESFSISSSSDPCEVLLQVIPLKVISNNGDSVTTYGLLDTGSDISMIDPSLAILLGIKGTPSRISLSTVSDTGNQESGMKVEFKISSLDDQRAINVSSAWAIKDLEIPLKHTKTLETVDRWPHLKGVPFPEVERKKISVLIGTGVQEAFIPLEVRQGKSNEPFAIRSNLGWSVLGGASKGRPCEKLCSNYICGEDVTLGHQLEEFWKVESYGIQKTEIEPMSVEDKRAMKVIEDTISKEEGHYQMGLLWKKENPQLPYNRMLAEARLRSLKGRLTRDPELLNRYKTAIEGHLAKGHARKLTNNETETLSKKTWYLPHHPVSNPNKPGKTRVVFDAAAKFGGTSLNDQLLQGPSLINDLTGVLIRFRQERIAFTADIESMFYQTKVIESDTDALRFLWWSNSLEDPPDEYKMLVHIFGAKSSPCCANKALRMTAEDNAADYDPEVIQSVYRNFYVDDVLKSAPTTEKAIHLATDLVKLLREGGFRLTKFMSNCREALTSIPPENRANPKLNLDLDKLPVERALGVIWDAETDTFGFKVIPTNKPSTKRGILSVISSLFDPLGFLAPLTLPMKILLQDLWRAGVSWDQDIPEPCLSSWHKWSQAIPHVAHVRIPRCFKSPELGITLSIQLHTFCDASRRGLAAVSYLRITDENGKTHCAFVMGKARNAPLREWTIPRLELQAAVVATRLCKTVLKELDLPINSTTFWTDSMTTLQYIRNQTRRFPVFVANRVTEIHEASLPEQWKHVPGLQNPADEGSRGTDIHYFKEDCRWWCGPKFLPLPEEQWPSEEPEAAEQTEETDTTATAMVITAGSQIDFLLRRYSSWPLLTRVMSWLLRFARGVKKEIRRYQQPSLSLVEIQEACREIVRIVQNQCFHEEYVALQEGRQVKRQSRLANLSPVLTDDVILVGGRVHRAPIPFSAAHPMILPKDHPISELIVRYYHEILGHAGREHVLSAIRQRYWILRARTLVRRVLHKCVKCRRRHASTMQQIMGNLPKERLTPFQPPFTYTGTDFFGPFYVKRGRSNVKVYGCIFVCFNTRAIHIEDVSSLETDTFIQALRRFISVRGSPKEIWSDNGTNFTGAEKELRLAVEELNQEEIKKAMHSKGTEFHSYPTSKWRFQPPAASHMSGVWERLIRSVRKTMKAIVGNPNSAIGLETLRTVFCEAVSILNSRPLCPSSDDPRDLEPLTPNHFLLLRPNTTPAPGIFTKEDLYSKKQWRHAQVLSNHFWTRWIREYLPNLQQRQKWLMKKRNLRIDDLVLVTDNMEPRCRWPLGRITRVFPGEDSHVRSAEVKTKSSTLVRPITKLCLLEESP